MKIDLHVHSKFSRRPSQWVLQKIGCPESFTEPRLIHRLAKERGMGLVTITDHNTIEGALAIADLPDTFISEEITTYFPGDGCKIHLLALHISEGQHQEIQRLRGNIFDLAGYLDKEGICPVVAHPLYAINDRLQVSHFQQLLLLFRHFELNGARSEEQNHTLRLVLGRLEAADIERLENLHNRQALGERPWEKVLTGGSDDHSGLNIARTHTRVAGATGIDSFFAGLLAGRCEVHGRASTPLTMAHNLYGIAYQFYRDKFQLAPHIHRDRLLTHLDRALQPEATTHGGLVTKISLYFNQRRRSRIDNAFPESLLTLIRQESERLFREQPEKSTPTRAGEDGYQERERQWFHFVNQVSNRVLAHSANHLLGHLAGANVFNIFQTIGSAGGLYALLAPFFVSFSQFNRDRALNDEVLSSWSPAGKDAPQPATTAKIAHFTDTFHQVNGVAHTLRQQIGAARTTGRKLTVITCEKEGGEGEPGLRNFNPIGSYELREYPGQKLSYPPFLEMLNFCHEERFSHIQSATPGPIGLAALAIARILNLPISGTYHTAFPQYAQYLTGDPDMEQLTWKYMLWYYDQMDQISVSSRNSAAELIDRGIRPEKIRLIPRGIDTKRFHPDKGNGLLSSRYRIKEETTLLYVGRVSKEKNLPVLTTAFASLSTSRPSLHLVVVGDGPYLKEMRQSLVGMPCTFTGFLTGEELATVYASADIFVFPSTTDTFGNVILEAQASGLPVIVSDQGGPSENVQPGTTGLVVPGGDSAALAGAIRFLAVNQEQRRKMGKAARQLMEERSFAGAFIRSWDIVAGQGGSCDDLSRRAA